MSIFERQVKGLIAICFVLALIPFISFFSSNLITNQLPHMINQQKNFLAVQFIGKNNSSGIYFLKPGTSAGLFYKFADNKQLASSDFYIVNGMKITGKNLSEKYEYVLGKIDTSDRLALGMPLDINMVAEDELLLIPGIGEATAKKIFDWRNKSGHFVNIDQLTEIKGIKDKRLTKLKKYLYVEKE